MVKILAIGDFHGKFPERLKKEAEKADLVLCTGDFGGSDKLLKIIFKYFYKDWTEVVGAKKAKKLILEDYNSGKRIINELGELGVNIYTVHGNWDFEEKKHKRRTGGMKLKKYSELMKTKKNIYFLNKKSINAKGLNVYGFGGMVTASVYLTKQGGFENKKMKKYKKEHETLRKLLFKNKEKNIDILLAHYPPYGFFDIVKYKGDNPMNGKHVGFEPYTEFIKKYQPRIFICGHMHEYQGIKKLGKTLIVATGSAKEGKAAIIDYPENKQGKIIVRLIK
jgi:Icc-related predicted phosphoesterase